MPGEKKNKWGTTQYCMLLEQIIEKSSKTATVKPLNSHHKPSKKDELGTVGEIRTNSNKCQSWSTSKNLHSSTVCGHWMPSRGLIECNGQ